MIKTGQITPIRIIAATADVTEPNKNKCIKYGFLELLLKPIQADKLKKILVKYL